MTAGKKKKKKKPGSCASALSSRPFSAMTCDAALELLAEDLSTIALRVYGKYERGLGGTSSEDIAHHVFWRIRIKLPSDTSSEEWAKLTLAYLVKAIVNRFREELRSTKRPETLSGNTSGVLFHSVLQCSAEDDFFRTESAFELGAVLRKCLRKLPRGEKPRKIARCCLRLLADSTKTWFERFGRIHVQIRTGDIIRYCLGASGRDLTPEQIYRLKFEILKPLRRCLGKFGHTPRTTIGGKRGEGRQEER